jgi:hypothetical protein
VAAATCPVKPAEFRRGSADRLRGLPHAHLSTSLPAGCDDSRVGRTGVLRVGMGVMALAVVAVGVLLLSPWWDRHRLNERLDSAAVPRVWTVAKTVQGSGDAPLGDDTRPWVIRQYRVTQPRATVVAQATGFLRRWGCDSPLRDDRANEVVLQTSCRGTEVALYVASDFVYTAAGGHSARTDAPPGGTVVSLWLGHQGP